MHSDRQINHMVTTRHGDRQFNWNWEDLELILGEVMRFPTPQRNQLKALGAHS